MTYPNTIGTEAIRRLGFSDIYRLTPGGTITCDLDTQGGLYGGVIVYSVDALPTKNSVWQAVTPDGTDNILAVVIPPEATGVAFVCNVLTDTNVPRLGARFSVRDANTANSLTRHQRQVSRSGDGEVITFTPKPLLLPPAGFIVRYFPTDTATVWQDTSRTMPVDIDGQGVNAIDGTGTISGQDMDTLTGSDNAPKWVENALSFGGTVFAGLEFDNGNTEGLRSVAASAPDPTQGGIVLFVCQYLGGAVGQTSTVAGAANRNWGEMRIASTVIQLRGTIGAVVQSFTHNDNAVVFAGWVNSNTVGNELDVSLSLVAGVDSGSKNVIDPDANDIWGLGVTQSGGQYADTNMRFIEMAAWDENTPGGVPDTDDIEAYVTQQYGITWL